MTFLTEAPEAKATLVFIPGGEGSRGVKPDWNTNHGYFSIYHFNVMLRNLSDPKNSSGTFNVVIFDNPKELLTSNHWSSARTSQEHLSRVEDVIRYYKEKLGKPVWLMGHSMGSISITEVYKRIQGNKSDDLVGGLILSGGVNGISLNYATTKLPVLVLHHENDECIGNTPGNAKSIYSKLREAGNLSAELVLINAGSRALDSNNPCRSGYHMYYAAGLEVTKVLDQFMIKHLY
jgi:hypothetical protein